MIETIIFLILSLTLFTCLFVENLRKKDKKELLFLMLDIVSILVFAIYFILNKSQITIIRFLSYSISIIIPIIIMLLNHFGYNLREGIAILTVNTLLTFGNRESAKKTISDFLEERPHSFVLHKKLGDIYKEEDEIKKAIEEYIQVLNLKQIPLLYLEVAEMFYNLGNKEEAKEILLYILPKEKDLLEGHLLLSQIYLETKQYKEAAKALTSALKCYGAEGNYDIYYQLGEIYAKINNFKESRYNFEKAYEIEGNKIIQLYIAQIYLIENEELKAIEAFKELLNIDELKPYVLYELAKVAKYKGEEDKAISYINEAFKYDDKVKERALKEDMFFDIRAKLVLSVKLDDGITTIKDDVNNKDFKAYKKNTNILEKFKLIEKEQITDKEIETIKHLSDIFSIINDMGDVTAQQKAKEKVDRIFEEKLGNINNEDQTSKGIDQK